MQEDCEGFLYPVVDESFCVDCHLCEKSCPIVNEREARKPIDVYAARTNDSELLYKSSSGGVFSVIAQKVIENHGVVFGACFDDNWEVHHDFTETLSGLEKFRGSKYVQSRIDDSFFQVKSFLNKDRIVLFSGTPCQIAGLKSYLNKECSNLLLVDVFCHGVPSPLVWRNYFLETFMRPLCAEDGEANSIVSKKRVIEGFSFRDKRYGWWRFGFSAYRRSTLRSDRDSVFTPIDWYEPRDNNVYFKGFMGNYFLRPSCYNCKFRCGKSHSDISIGDYWGYNVNHDDDDKGMSALFVNTTKGQFFLEKLDLVLESSNYDEVLSVNPILETSVSQPQYRAFFWKNYSNNLSDTLDIVKSKEKPSAIRLLCSRVKAKLTNQ